ncbi:hypothetical protein ACP4OV_024499 [Aristida adscensionis]
MFLDADHYKMASRSVQQHRKARAPEATTITLWKHMLLRAIFYLALLKMVLASGMALSKPLCSGLEGKHVELTVEDSNTAGVIPADTIYEILLRLPAKELCRLRIVCRQWRSLLSNQQFIAAHRARHPGPFIMAGYPYFVVVPLRCHPELLGNAPRRNNGILCEIIDLSGHVIKRVRATWGEFEYVESTHLDLICTTKEKKLINSKRSLRLVDPANGTVYGLPEGPAQEHDNVDIGDWTAMVMFGQVSSTGQYKVLRILRNNSFRHQLCEILTLDGSINARWRGKKAPPGRLGIHNKVAINGIVYFFLDEDYLGEDGVMQKRIASFDLETEEWRTVLRGPMIRIEYDHVALLNNHSYSHVVSLAALNGNLVLVHRASSTMDAPWSRADLWFLIDFEQSLWVKKHSIRVKLSVRHKEYNVLPLLVLNDGRIVTYIGIRGLLRIYDPMTGAYTDVAEIGHRPGIGLYTGNLLSLPNGIN